MSDDETRIEEEADEGTIDDDGRIIEDIGDLIDPRETGEVN